MKCFRLINWFLCSIERRILNLPENPTYLTQCRSAVLIMETHFHTNRFRLSSCTYPLVSSIFNVTLRTNPLLTFFNHRFLRSWTGNACCRHNQTTYLNFVVASLPKRRYYSVPLFWLFFIKIKISRVLISTPISAKSCSL